MPLARHIYRILIKILIILLVSLALTASPSILRGFVDETFIFAIATLLLLILGIIGRIPVSSPLIASAGIAIPLVLVSSIYYSHLIYQGMKPFAGVYILIVTLLISGLLADRVFSDTVMEVWNKLFWIVSVSSILTWFLSYLTPSLFKVIEYGELYSGNVREYWVSLIGVYINQDYGSFELHRVVGFLAEPGMMSMLFAINACLGLLYKNTHFTRKWGLANLIAGFCTYSVAYYFAISIVGLYVVLAKRGLGSLRMFTLLILIVTSLIFMNSIVKEIQYLKYRSSFNKREKQVLSLVKQIERNPAGLFFGYVWYNAKAQFPSTLLTLVFQSGLLGVVAFFWYISRFMTNLPEVLIVFLSYSMTLQYHTYFAVAFALIVVGALQQSLFYRPPMTLILRNQGVELERML